MNEKPAFPAGTRFFIDGELDPVAVIPVPGGMALVAFVDGKAVRMSWGAWTSAGRPPREVSADEFRSKAGPESLRAWFVTQSTHQSPEIR